MKTILKAANISKSFISEGKVLKNIDVEFKSNTFTAVLGPSGSGKSTLLNVCAGLMKMDSGELIYNGTTLQYNNNKQMCDWKRNKIGVIFQNYLLISDLTVRENIELGRSPKQGNLPLNELTKTLGIYEQLEKYPGELSGGQQQRVSIARAVIKKPEILFCDEATGALDELNSKQVVALLHEIKEQYHTSIIFITHNAMIAHTAERIITMKDGTITEDIINQNPISAYDMEWR